MNNIFKGACQDNFTCIYQNLFNLNSCRIEIEMVTSASKA